MSSSSPTSPAPNSFPRALRIKLFKSLLGLLFAVAGIELAFRLFMPVNLDFYNWQKIKRIAKPPKEGLEFIPGGRNDFYVGVPVQINSIGLRDVEIEIPKPADTIRVLVVGDSVTFGYGVRLEDTFLKVLESNLNRSAAGTNHYEVINGGMDGTGLDRHYQFLESAAPGLEPDLVIVALSLNDIVDYRKRHQESRREFSPTSPVRRLNSFLLLHSQAYLASYLRLKTLLYRYGVLDFNEEHWYEIDILKPPTDALREAWNSSGELLSNITALARKRGYAVAFVIFPMEAQLNQAALETYQRELRLNITAYALRGDAGQELVRLGASLGVPVLDLLPSFRAVNDTDLFLRGRSMMKDPMHPSVAGHRVAGDALFRFLKTDPGLAGILWRQPDDA